jgi:hypothetical protein
MALTAAFSADQSQGDDQPHDPHAAAAADGPLGVRHAVTAVSVVTDTCDPCSAGWGPRWERIA